MPEYQQLASGSTWVLAQVADHLLQATVGFLVVFFLTALLKHGTARVRYTLWLMAGAQLLLPLWICGLLLDGSLWSFSPSEMILRSESSFSLAPSTISKVAGKVAQFPQSSYHANTSPRGTPHIAPALIALWLLGFTGFNIRWWRRRRLVLRIIQAGQELTQGPAIEALHRIDTQASGNRIIRLRASPEVQEPGVWGVQRPIIMLPQNLTDQLSNEEIEAVLLHELIHIRRWDNLVSQFQMALCSLFWFYPIVWIIDRRLLAEREQVCDEEVLRLGYSSNHYVSSLRKVFQFCLGQTVSGVSLASGSNLKRRIENIMSRKVQPNLTHWQRVLVAGSAGIMILGSIVTGVHSQEKKESASFPDAHRQLKTALNSPTEVAGMSSKGTGTLSGSVNDASGARIPRAIVVVSNPRTGQKEITTTSPSGEYEFKLLPAGSYLLEVEELGFKLFQRQSVIVRANVKEHQDVTMEVGEVIQTIEITGKTPRVPIIPETSSPPRRIRVGGNVQATKLIVEVKPIYPENLQQAGIQGIVLMEAIIAKDGSVRAVRAINTLVNRELVEAALDAVKRWRYEPTLLNGEPIEVVTTIKVNFRLTDE